MYTLQTQRPGAIAPVAGQRISSRLANAVLTNWITLRLTGTLTIAGGAADAIRNRGSILAAFDEIGLSADGEDVQLYDGPALRFASEMAAPSALSAQRVGSTAAAAYPLEESVRIFCAHPFAARPGETAFRERDVNVLFEVFAKLAASGGGDRLAKVSGGVTAVLSNVNITVQHTFNRSGDAPLFIPRVRSIVQNVAGANDNEPLFIKTTRNLRGLIVSQSTTTDGEVSDIINALALRHDLGDIIGPQQVAWDDLALGSEYEFGGAVLSSNRAHLGLNFQYHGKLSYLLTPLQTVNLRLELDCQPSVAGAGTSRVRVTLFELDRDPRVCGPMPKGLAEAIPVAG